MKRIIRSSWKWCLAGALVVACIASLLSMRAAAAGFFDRMAARSAADLAIPVHSLSGMHVYISEYYPNNCYCVGFASPDGKHRINIILERRGDEHWLPVSVREFLPDGSALSLDPPRVADGAAH